MAVLRTAGYDILLAIVRRSSEPSKVCADSAFLSNQMPDLMNCDLFNPMITILSDLRIYPICSVRLVPVERSTFGQCLEVHKMFSCILYLIIRLYQILYMS